MFVGEEDRYLLGLDLHANVPVTLDITNDTERSVDLVKRGGVKYATVLPRGNFKTRAYIRDCLTFADSESGDRIGATVRYVGGDLPSGRGVCHHFFAHVNEGIVPLKEIALKRVSTCLKDREAIDDLKLPATLGAELAGIARGRLRFLEEMDCVCVNRDYSPKRFHLRCLLSF